MKKPIVSALIVTASAAMCWTSNPAEANTDPARRTLLKAIVLNMGNDGLSVTDGQYNSVFKEGNAAVGVAAVIKAGGFSINGYPLPGTASDLEKRYPAGYLVNQVPWLSYDGATTVWKGGYKAARSETSYAAAALATVTGIVAGVEVRLYDTNGDGYTDRIDADYKEGVIADRITRNEDDTYSVYRGDIDTANKTSREGRTFDGPHFSLTSGERIKARNFDRTIGEGDVTLFWYGPDGWVMQRAKQITGKFLGGADHNNYNVGGVVYQDAMRFSRDNIPVSNRPGEYVNAQNYFGFDKSDGDRNVNFWLVPTTDGTARGAPVALTSGESARTLLTEAVAVAGKKLSAVTVSASGSDVPADRTWVTQAAYTQAGEAIERAKAVLRSRQSSPSLFDYQTYLLYLTLAGSSSDIGAKSGRFDYPGFDHEMKAGTQPVA